MLAAQGFLGDLGGEVFQDVLAGLGQLGRGQVSTEPDQQVLGLPGEFLIDLVREFGQGADDHLGLVT